MEKSSYGKDLDIFDDLGGATGAGAQTLSAIFRQMEQDELRGEGVFSMGWGTRPEHVCLESDNNSVLLEH